MKTRNNVQKAILKSMAVVVSLVLISFTVSAQGFWESLLENTTFNEIALAMVTPISDNEPTIEVDKDIDTDAFDSFLEVEEEDVLEVEDWMTNEANFEPALTIETEIDEPLKVEDWMINETYFGGTTFNVEIETEEVLEVEDWMLDSELFEGKTKKGDVIVRGNYIIGKTFIYLNVEQKDEELKLESWMVSPKVWGK